MNDYSKDAWKYYEYGRAYNSNLTPNQYTVVNTNREFFAGNQWLHMPDNEAMRRLSKPVFNIIKRVTSLFVASLTSSNTTISFEPLSLQGDNDAASFATAEVRNLLEKFKMDYRIRDALFDGAITGDYAAHFYWNPDARPYGGAFGAYKGEIEMEMVDGINIMFGNPNLNDIERQPYVLVVGRDTVENLKREAEKWGQDSLSLRPDADPYHLEIRGNDDKTGKALYVYLYTKVWNGESFTVHVTKATRSCNIFEDIDTGLSRYPIAWGNWQRQKNQYHGRALVTEIIPNQIFINQMMAMVFRHLQTQAFPTKLYNADLLPNISNEVGTSIGVRNLMPGQSLGDVMATIPAANMSAQIIQAIDLCMTYTKECLGATDAQMGNVSPDNTSALMVLQNSAEVPLENTRAGLHEWIEDIGSILLDMMGTYYGVRPIVRDGEMQLFDFSIFKQLWLNVSVDVGATSYYSEIAMVQTLDNLRHDGTLNILEYLERMPDKLISRKQDLIDDIKARMQLQGTMPAAQTSSKGGGSGVATQLSQLPTSIQAKYSSLPKVAQRALIK